MDWSDSVSAGIGGGFGLIGSALNYHFQSKLMEQQNKYNLEMWKLQNEYNSPAAQMQRYQEAGLNPALMYGQVTPGNATNAPHMGTPQAPKLSRDMAELGKLFNIEGLKQAIADTKTKQANARLAQTAADQAHDEYEGAKAIGQQYDFDPSTGAFYRLPQDQNGVVVYANPYAHYKKMKILADNYRTNSLLVPRANLIGSQAALNYTRGAYTSSQHDYLIERQKMLAPQLRMLDYQSKHFPTSFWIGTAARGAQAVSPFLPIIF